MNQTGLLLADEFLVNLPADRAVRNGDVVDRFVDRAVEKGLV